MTLGACWHLYERGQPLPKARLVASFPSPKVTGAVTESLRRLCELRGEEFEALPDLAKLRKLNAAMGPVRSVECQQALPVALSLAVTIVRWASHGDRGSQESIIETTSSSEYVKS
jgi:hypothetical protein